MKVKLLETSEERPELTPGREYVVIGFDDENYRIVNDSDEPILYPKSDFIVVDHRVPADWRKDDFDEGDYYVDPPELAGKGFYEDYFDGDEEAREKFWAVYERVLKEQG